MSNNPTKPNRARDQGGSPYSGTPYPVTASGQVITGPTYLGAIVINDPGTSWVLSLYDGTDGSGTPFAVIKPSGSGGNFVYDCGLKKGLYISSSGTAGHATAVVN